MTRYHFNSFCHFFGQKCLLILCFYLKHSNNQSLMTNKHVHQSHCDFLVFSRSWWQKEYHIDTVGVVFGYLIITDITQHSMGKCTYYEIAGYFDKGESASYLLIAACTLKWALKTLPSIYWHHFWDFVV